MRSHPFTRRAPALLVLTCALCTGCGDDAEKTAQGTPPEDDGAAAATSVEQGVCFGKLTNCDLPEFVRVTPKEELSVTCAEGAELEVVRTATLRTFDCTVPGCPAGNPVVAANAGRYWVVAELSEPGLGGEPVGFAVVVYDENGRLLDSSPTDVRWRLVAPIMPGGYTRSVQVDAEGGLAWATPSSDRKGIELRRYAADGTLSSARVAIAEASAGHAKWAADGSAVLGYRYFEDEIITDPLNQESFPGIARFDGRGRVLYNQTLLARLVDADSDVLGVVVRVAGIGNEGETTFRLAERGPYVEIPYSGSSYGETRLLRLDKNGNVVWARELANAYLWTSETDMKVLADGSSLIVHRNAEPLKSIGEPVPYFVDRLDNDGNSSWRARLDAPPLIEHLASVVVTIDSKQRVLLSTTLAYDDAGVASGGAVVVFDTESRTCTYHALRTGCDITSGCDHMSAVAVDSAYLYYGTGKLIGVAKLP
jgi:hypothetical protein